MKLLTINICPPDKCPDYLKNTLTNLGSENRARKIINLIQAQKPDVVFFIEQWYPVYSLVKAKLGLDYKFVLPKGFNPARLSREGEYSSYAGMAAAVKTGILVTTADGSGYVEKAGKWLCLEISGRKYLGVHYPQPQSDGNPNMDFHSGVLKFAREEKPAAILGDFNTPKYGNISITDYKDLLSENAPTSAFRTKLDYIFLPNDNSNAEFELIKTAMEGDTIFSDHAATMVTLSFTPHTATA